jgi:hypothetical protein
LLSAITATRILFILGFVNLVTGLAIFFSCRCFPGSRIGKKFMRYRWFQGFFKIHCYIWWVFWVSVIIHASLAIPISAFRSSPGGL